MTGTSNGKSDYWKWIAAALLSLVMFMLGSFVENLIGTTRLDSHAEKAGHPVMVQRVDNLEQVLNLQLMQMNQRLDRIEKKLD